MADARRDQLRAELIRLRIQAGLGGRPLAARLGVTQATVSRIERGLTLPSLPVVRSWLDACDADEAIRVTVLVLAETLHTASRGWSALLAEHGHAQREFRARDTASTRVQNFQPTVVPGLLQTPEYARAVLRLGRTRDVEAAVAERVARQAVLHDEGRRFSFLLAERVLRWPVGGHEVVAAQRDRIVSLGRLPAVEVAVLPDAVVTLALWSNFVIWHPTDGPAFAGVETWLGEDRVTDPGDVETLAGVWTRLWDAAVHGEDAVELIRKA